MEHTDFERDLKPHQLVVWSGLTDENFFDILKTDLMRLGLLMGSDSRKRAEYLGRSLASLYYSNINIYSAAGCLELFGPKSKAMADY